MQLTGDLSIIPLDETATIAAIWERR
jgi:hypothetical protein